MPTLRLQTGPVILVLLLAVLSAGPVAADLRVGSICRVKGQEENTLHGMGLVVGLKGTGDTDIPASMRALAQMMTRLGHRVGENPQDTKLVAELKNARNVALVFVTVTVPERGAREGGRLDCTINAISAKSLEGGYLMLTPLVGPRVDDATVYGLAKGPLVLEDSSLPTSAKIDGGCRVEVNLHNRFTDEGFVTLVLADSHAGFEAAFEVEEVINRYPAFADLEVAKAVDPKNVLVRIPPQYADRPVEFVATLNSIPMLGLAKDARVVINERTGVIVIGSDVEVRSVAVAHKNLTIEAGSGTAANRFIPVDPAADTSTTRLKALVDALNAIKVPTPDIIDVIKGLHHSGNLYGQLVLE